MNEKNKLYDELLFNADKYIDGNKETFNELTQSTDYDELKYILVRFREIGEFNKLLKELNGESIFDLNEFINYIITLNSVNESKYVTTGLDENKCVKGEEKKKLYDKLLFNTDKYINTDKHTFYELSKSKDYDKIEYILTQFGDIDEFNKLLKEFNGESIFDLTEFVNYIIKVNSIYKSKYITTGIYKKDKLYDKLLFNADKYIDGDKRIFNELTQSTDHNGIEYIFKQLRDINKFNKLLKKLNGESIFNLNEFINYIITLNSIKYKDAKLTKVCKINESSKGLDENKSVKAEEKKKLYVYDELLFNADKYIDADKYTFYELTKSTDYDEIEYILTQFRDIGEFNKLLTEFDGESIFDLNEFINYIIKSNSVNESINERKLTEDEIEYFKFLNYLRDSGITNMYGASPYLVDTFDLDKKEARNVLALWMNNFNEDENTYNDLEIED